MADVTTTMRMGRGVVSVCGGMFCSAVTPAHGPPLMPSACFYAGSGEPLTTGSWPLIFT